MRVAVRGEKSHSAGCLSDLMNYPVRGGRYKIRFDAPPSNRLIIIAFISLFWKCCITFYISDMLIYKGNNILDIYKHGYIICGQGKLIMLCFCGLQTSVRNKWYFLDLLNPSWLSVLSYLWAKFSTYHYLCDNNNLNFCKGI